MRATRDIIYRPEEVPDNFVTLTEAATITGMHIDMLRTRVRRRRLAPRGRVRACAPGGGYILVDLLDVIAAQAERG